VSALGSFNSSVQESATGSDEVSAASYFCGRSGRIRHRIGRSFRRRGLSGFGAGVWAGAGFGFLAVVELGIFGSGDGYWGLTGVNSNVDVFGSTISEVATASEIVSASGGPLVKRGRVYVRVRMKCWYGVQDSFVKLQWNEATCASDASI
jgi:hypothetical protein